MITKVCVSFLIVSLSTFTYWQHVSDVQRLSISGWDFHVDGERVVLRHQSDYSSKDLAHLKSKWKPSAPHIKTIDGEYLSFDLAGKDPVIRVSKERGPNTEWAFKTRERMAPVTKTRTYKLREFGTAKYSEGETGFKVLLQATEGPFKGYYLCVAGPLTREKREENSSPELKTLILVADQKQASEVTFVERIDQLHHSR